MTHDELIAALEKAKGADQRLDAEILAHLVGGTVEQFRINSRWCVSVTGYSGKTRLWQPRRREEQKWRMAKFTASIDAALTLVPERHNWLTCIINGSVQAQIGPTNSFQAADVRGVATPALALCIAALRARGDAA
jgi:hypothetical protein